MDEDASESSSSHMHRATVPVMDNTAQEEYRCIFDWLRFKEIVCCIEGWVSAIIYFAEILNFYL